MVLSVSGRGGLLDNRAHLGPGAGSSDEDPYSVAGSGSSGSSGNGNTRNRWEGGGERRDNMLHAPVSGPAPETVLHNCRPATTASTAARAASGAPGRRARPGPRPVAKRRRRRPEMILTTSDYRQGFLISWRAERRNRRSGTEPILDRYI